MLEKTASTLPLNGVRILDMSAALSGPFATQILGDLGAEVLKIEPPKGEFTRTTPPVYLQDTSLFFIANNRNKRGLVIDLKSEGGREVFYDLVKHADIVFHNYSGGVAERLKIDHETISVINPRIITCMITGLGSRGPQSRHPLVDTVAQAIAGAISITGEEGGPPTKAGIGTADLSTGLYACIGMLAALQSRALTGRGMKIEASLFHSQLSLLNFSAVHARYTGTIPQKTGTGHVGNAASQAFKTSDGWVVVDASFNHHFRSLCHALEIPELAEDERFVERASRNLHRDELARILEEVFLSNNTAHWAEAIAKRHVPSGPVLNVQEALQHPQAQAYHAVRKVRYRDENVDVLATPLWFDDQLEPPLADPPFLGQHTIDALAGILGYASDKIDKLIDDGAVEAYGRSAKEVPNA